MPLIEIGLTGAGLLILLVGFYEAQKLRKTLGTGTLKDSWDVLSVFIGLFMVGYSGYIANMLLDTVTLNTQLLTSTVFFLGSIFVAMTSYYNRKAFTAVQ